jgi:hypothetical protein
MSVRWPAMSGIGRIGADMSTKTSGFDLGSIRVGFVVEKVALGQVFLLVIRVSLSITFHQYSRFIFIMIILLREVKKGEVRKPPNITMRPLVSESAGQESIFV